MDSIKNNDYIDLLEIARDLWVYKFLLIILAVVIAVLSVVKVEFFTDDKYVAYGILYVSNKQNYDEDDSVSQNDIDTARSMSLTYREILKTRTFLSEVSADVDGKFKWNQISSMTSISPVNETELLKISVVANTPEDAYLVAESIVRNAPDKLGSVFENGLIKIVDEVIPPSGPVGKGAAKQGVIGAIAGLAIGCIFVVIRNMFDTKIHKSEDVAKRYSVSVLGEVAQ